MASRYDFPQTIKGDTFNGILFTIKVNSIALDLTDAIINMDLRLIPSGVSVKRFTSIANEHITISATPADGKFTFNNQIINVAAENYKYDIQIVLGDDTVKTYIYGNWTIIQDVTYDQ